MTLHSDIDWDDYPDVNWGALLVEFSKGSKVHKKYGWAYRGKKTEIQQRKLDSEMLNIACFRRILSGETYLSVALDLDCSDTRIRTRCRKVARSANQLSIGKRAENKLQWPRLPSTREMRANKSYWLRILAEYEADLHAQHLAWLDTILAEYEAALIK